MDGISRSRGWDKEIPHGVLPMEQLVLSDKLARHFWSRIRMGQWPMSHSFACKNQDFDEPFEILMGHLEKKMGPRNLNIHLTAK